MTKYIIFNSYDLRDDIKVVGGVYNKDNKGWVVDAAQLDILRTRATDGKWGMSTARAWAKSSVSEFDRLTKPVIEVKA